jgi:inositol transport system substrate-binding protein
MKTLLRPIVLAMLSLGALAAPCHAQQEPQKTILVSLSNASEPFMTMLRAEAENEASRLNVLVIFEDGKGDSAQQANDLENAISKKPSVDGIVVAPNDVYALVPAIDLALEKGVPIITVDRRIYGASKPVPHVGIDNVTGGRVLAQWVVHNFPNGARILHLTGQPGSSTGIERAEGVRDELREAGAKYQIVADVPANWSRSEAQTATERQLAFLKQPPEVVIADNDDMAMGALQGIHLGGADGSGVKVVGFDALPFALAKLREGALSATVDQQGGQQIRLALQRLVDKLRTGKDMESAKVDPILVTADKLN